MKLAAIVVAIYGLFTLIGGFIGYLKAGSRASLIAGGISGIVLLSCVYGLIWASTAAAGLSLAVALVLGVRFLGTWSKKRRVMPDLLMVVLSALAAVTVIVELISRSPR